MSAKMILRTACGLLITLAILFSGTTPVYAQAPANDNFANATIISSTPFEEHVIAYDATFEEGEPIPSCVEYYTPGNTIWYAYTPSVSGFAQVYILENYYAFLAVYTGSDLSDLTQQGCWGDFNNSSFSMEAGTTYYLQLGTRMVYGGVMNFHFDFIPPPPNDNFANASAISLGQFLSSNNTAASLEVGEPRPPCGDAIKTVWYVFTPTTSGFITASPNEWWNFVAVYTGSELGNLVYITCRNPLPFMAEANTTYFFQVGSRYEWWGYGAFEFRLYETPPPTADFSWWPGDPSSYDTVEFSDWSSDPVDMGFEEFQWDFGDGVTTTGAAYHRYSADGDYTVWHNVQTFDGRTDPDGITKTISVRTHDVAAVRVAAPKSASVGQTRPITLYIKNNHYPERVEIQLYKSVPGGFEWVSSTYQNIPVRGGNRTTAVSFSYTFTQADADIGKVTFKAVVNLIDARDALPGDNEAISPPTRVQ